MSRLLGSRTWLGRNKWYLIALVAVLCFALAPFPGCGAIYPLTDRLRGHPEGSHGTQPQKFVGLWIREETVPYDFLGQAFYLMSDGRFASMRGMTERRWHFDDERLYVDSVSHCGNCYRGNVTTEHSVRLVGADQMIVTKSTSLTGIVGTYRRVAIDKHLKSEMDKLKASKDDGEWHKARSVLMAIEDFEFWQREAPIQ